MGNNTAIVNQESSQKLSQDRERLTMRAKDLQRQRLVLENELSSPGILGSQRDYLQQRIQALSGDEDLLSQKLAYTERELGKVRSQSQKIGEQPMPLAAQAFPEKNKELLSPAAQQRILHMKSRLKAHFEADEVDVLKNAQKPVLLGFVSLFIIAFIIDLLNMFAAYFLLELGGLLFAIDLCVSIILYFCIRAFINRDLLAHGILSACLFLTGIILIVAVSFVFTAPFSFLALIPLMPVLLAGIINPGARVTSVDKDQITDRLKGYEQKVQQAQKTGKSLGVIAKESKKISFLGRTMLGTVLNFIPWQSINVVLTYRSLKKNYKESQQLAAEYEQRQSIALEAEISSIAA